MVTAFRRRGRASARTLGMCEQAVRTMSMVATEVSGLKLTVAHCWPSAASNFAQPAAPRASARASPADPAAAVAAGHRARLWHACQLSAPAGEGSWPLSEEYDPRYGRQAGQLPAGLQPHA